MDTGVLRRLPAARVLALVATLLIPAVATAQPEPIPADVVDNGPLEQLDNEPTLRAKQALLTRYEDKLVFDVRMDTPAPGSYVYPEEVLDTKKAPPEVYTAWVFVFNNPEHCVGDEDWDWCAGNDFTEAVQAGVYGVAGHVSSIDHEGGGFILDRGTDGQIVLRGEIALGDAQRPDLPPNETTYPLSDPLGAEVHLAIAPHGQVDPATVATELYSPAGNPICGCWWVSFFGLEGYDGGVES